MPALGTTEGTAVRSIVGINEDGVFGVTRAAWRPDLPDALQEPFIPLLWVKVQGAAWPGARVSTARFVKDGMLPGEAQSGATVYRMAS